MADVENVENDTTERTDVKELAFVKVRRDEREKERERTIARKVNNVHREN